MATVLPIGISVGSKLLSTAPAFKGVDCIRILPDFVPVFFPPFIPATSAAEFAFPAYFRLLQKSTAVLTLIIVFSTFI